MKMFRPGIALSLTLLVALIAVISSQSVAYAPSKPATVAVIDVMKLYEELAEKLALEADQQQQRTRLEEERQTRLAEIKTLEKDLSELAIPNTTAFERKQDELLTKTAEYQAWFSVQQQRLQRDVSVRIQGIEKKMNEAIAQTAKDNNIDLVMNRQTNIPIVPPSQQQQQQNFSLRMVLFAVDELDITHEVAQLMNNDFNNRPAQP
jgi:Skp family chaperone for outer membrane proteins